MRKKKHSWGGKKVGRSEGRNCRGKKTDYKDKVKI